MQESLWDVEGFMQTEATRVADMIVAPVHATEIHEFCQRYHYTESGGSTCWNYGLWHELTLMGVISYNLPTRITCASVFGEEHVQHVAHMGRLAMADDAPKNSESRLIAASLKMLSKDIRDGESEPWCWAVLSFSAPDVRNPLNDRKQIGYVYQATNALYTGTGGDAFHYVNAKGQRQSSSRGMNAAKAAELGWKKVPGNEHKHRYLYLLGSKTQRKRLRSMLKLPVLADQQNPAGYPKELTSEEAVS